MQSFCRAGHLIILACSIFLSGIVTAQEEQTAKEGPDNIQPINKLGPRTDKRSADVDLPKDIKLEKRKKATIGLAAVGGIAILGIGAIAITMLWARRLRRLARDLGPTQKTAGNDFWFLKPEKPIASEANVADTHRPLHPPPTGSPE